MAWVLQKMCFYLTIVNTIYFSHAINLSSSLINHSSSLDIKFPNYHDMFNSQHNKTLPDSHSFVSDETAFSAPHCEKQMRKKQTCFH